MRPCQQCGALPMGMDTNGPDMATQARLNNLTVRLDNADRALKAAIQFLAGMGMGDSVRYVERLANGDPIPHEPLDPRRTVLDL